MFIMNNKSINVMSVESYGTIIARSADLSATGNLNASYYVLQLLHQSTFHLVRLK
jgi:hypothetical protein